MEEVLNVRRGPSIVFRKFLVDYVQNTEPYLKSITEQEISDVLNLSHRPDIFKQLKDSCSLDKINTQTSAIDFVQGGTEVHRMPNILATLPDSFKLETYYKLSRSKESSKTNPFTRSEYSYKMMKRPSTVCIKQKPGTPISRELLVTVRIYRPARATHEGQTLEKPVFADEFKCLGSNYLTALRDKIPCICNKNRFFDISDNPEADLPEKMTDPGYFFIHETFYNDKRNPENPDYSETVRKWASMASGMSNVQFKVADMAQTCFIDLEASLGFPYLYLHHGNCEHIFVFSQLEVLAPCLKSRLRCQYPYLNSYNVYNNHACHMCGARNYSFIVEQSKRQLYDPSYLCSTCFYGFHYVDGKKIEQFKAYRIANITAAEEQPGGCPSDTDSGNITIDETDHDFNVIKKEQDNDTTFNLLTD